MHDACLMSSASQLLDTLVRVCSLDNIFKMPQLEPKWLRIDSLHIYMYYFCVVEWCSGPKGQNQMRCGKKIGETKEQCLLSVICVQYNERAYIYIYIYIYIYRYNLNADDNHGG